MAKLIKSNGEILEVRPADGSDRFTLEETQRCVGGYIEVVRCRFHLPEGENPLLLVNEEGRLLHLPVNEDASGMAGIVLVGDVLQLTPQEWKATMDYEEEEVA